MELDCQHPGTNPSFSQQGGVPKRKKKKESGNRNKLLGKSDRGSTIASAYVSVHTTTIPLALAMHGNFARLL